MPWSSLKLGGMTKVGHRVAPVRVCVCEVTGQAWYATWRATWLYRAFACLRAVASEGQAEGVPATDRRLMRRDMRCGHESRSSLRHVDALRRGERCPMECVRGGQPGLERLRRNDRLGRGVHVRVVPKPLRTSWAAREAPGSAAPDQLLLVLHGYRLCGILAATARNPRSS